MVTRLRHDDIVATVTAKEEAADMIIDRQARRSGRPSTWSISDRISSGSYGRAESLSSWPNRAFRPIARVLIAYDGGSRR